MGVGELPELQCAKPSGVCGEGCVDQANRAVAPRATQEDPREELPEGP